MNILSMNKQGKLGDLSLLPILVLVTLWATFTTAPDPADTKDPPAGTTKKDGELTGEDVADVNTFVPTKDKMFVIKQASGELKFKAVAVDGPVGFYFPAAAADDRKVEFDAITKGPVYIIIADKDKNTEFTFKDIKKDVVVNLFVQSGSDAKRTITFEKVDAGAKVSVYYGKATGDELVKEATKKCVTNKKTCPLNAFDVSAPITVRFGAIDATVKAASPDSMFTFDAAAAAPIAVRANGQVADEFKKGWQIVVVKGIKSAIILDKGHKGDKKAQTIDFNTGKDVCVVKDADKFTVQAAAKGNTFTALAKDDKGIIPAEYTMKAAQGKIVIPQNAKEATFLLTTVSGALSVEVGVATLDKNAKEQDTCEAPSGGGEKPEPAPAPVEKSVELTLVQASTPDKVKAEGSKMYQLSAGMGAVSLDVGTENNAYLVIDKENETTDLTFKKISKGPVFVAMEDRGSNSSVTFSDIGKDVHVYLNVAKKEGSGKKIVVSKIDPTASLRVSYGKSKGDDMIDETKHCPNKKCQSSSFMNQMAPVQMYFGKAVKLAPGTGTDLEFSDDPMTLDVQVNGQKSSRRQRRDTTAESKNTELHITLPGTSGMVVNFAGGFKKEAKEMEHIPFTYNSIDNAMMCMKHADSLSFEVHAPTKDSDVFQQMIFKGKKTGGKFEFPEAMGKINASCKHDLNSGATYEIGKVPAGKKLDFMIGNLKECAVNTKPRAEGDKQCPPEKETKKPSSQEEKAGNKTTASPTEKKSAADVLALKGLAALFAAAVALCARA